MRLVKSTFNQSATLGVLLIISILFLLSSCMSIKPGSSKSGKKYYESFYVGEGGTQYFIKPISFEKEKGKDEVFLDFTFRYRDNMNSNAVINYSVQIDEIIREVDSLVIINASNSMTSSVNKLLFNTREGDGFQSRYSTEVPLKKLKDLFGNNEWAVKVYATGKEHIFYPSNKSKKKIKILNDNVFILFN
ncbi:hypothetical protein ERX46_06165 [Brumimicrobium glaciale]|uniref:Lipoprotein n=1 Tax=Brumimicrobium glaciale TaxID=200475 RepID=A0A4Q4KNH7_9FLAO|nr:hypothetical protein [Brumimicrobium glaciale]RYM34955.1 hypothetical protein ERX46_06165 [Brumimicrobium glaciale]